jgi:hypothetical protein
VNELRTAREALLAEAIGGVARLVEQLEAVASKLDENRDALGQACERLSREARAFETRLARVTEHAQGVALRHIALRTDEVAREAVAPAIRAVLRDELRQALQHGDSAALVARRLSALPSWLTHLAAALVGGALTWAAAAWLCAH